MRNDIVLKCYECGSVIPEPICLKKTGNEKTFAEWKPICNECRMKFNPPKKGFLNIEQAMELWVSISHALEIARETGKTDKEILDIFLSYLIQIKNSCFDQEPQDAAQSKE